MEKINKILANLDEQATQQLKKYWDCLAKLRFERKLLAPMVSNIQNLNTQTDKLRALCDAAEAVAAELTAAGLSAIAVRMDVSSEEEVERGFDRMMEVYGSCDLVMSNAGVQIVHPFDEYPFEDWRKMMAIHADGAFLVSRAAFRRMKAGGKGGRIVFTGSVQSFVGSKLKEPYNFAKHGVAGLAKAVAREGADYGIYTYTICPSFIKTPLVEKQIPEQARDLGITEEEVVKNIMPRDTVDGQFTTVEDVANTLAFLANDQGALTGQSLRLTHGWAMM